MARDDHPDNKQKQKRTLVGLYLALVATLFLIGIFIIWKYEKDSYHTVETDTVNLRNGPGITYDIKTQAKSGARYRLIEEQQDWEKVLLENGQAGWMPKWLSSSSWDQNQTDESGTGFIATIIKDTDARQDAKEDGKKVADVAKNGKYNILFQQKGWLQVQLNQQLGWIKQEDVEITPGHIPYQSDSSSATEDTTFLKDYDYTVTAEADGAHIRKEPDSNSDIVKEAKMKESFAYLGQSGAFYHVKASDGTEGYLANWLATSNSKAMQKLAETAKATTTLNQKTIVIDAGHGGEDPGAIAQDNTTYEKNMTLNTAKATQKALEAAGAKVIMTRTDDTYVGLAERGELANKNNVDAFISFHYDSAEEKTASGTTLYYYHDHSIPMIQAIQAQLLEQGALPNTGYDYANYQVLRDTKMVATLIELGYMSNPSDVKVFNQDSYYQKVAKAVVDGLTVYFNQKADLMKQIDPTATGSATAKGTTTDDTESDSSSSTDHTVTSTTSDQATSQMSASSEAGASE
ncbi:MAG: N-acetylmuramoyl-L-alanine amidase [Aerococcus sp.]|nr:N-acetylmuramoyl-L-alanine amidase [Aerococcus sp.]